jgi:hypothetical protein
LTGSQGLAQLQAVRAAQQQQALENQIKASDAQARQTTAGAAATTAGARAATAASTIPKTQAETERIRTQSADIPKAREQEAKKLDQEAQKMEQSKKESEARIKSLEKGSENARKRIEVEEQRNKQLAVKEGGEAKVQEFNARTTRLRVGLAHQQLQLAKERHLLDLQGRNDKVSEGISKRAFDAAKADVENIIETSPDSSTLDIEILTNQKYEEYLIKFGSGPGAKGPEGPPPQAPAPVSEDLSTELVTQSGTRYRPTLIKKMIQQLGDPRDPKNASKYAGVNPKSVEAAKDLLNRGQ